MPEELGYIKTLDHEFTKYAYVIFDTNYRKNMAVINNYFSGLEGFELLGRWGRWNYNNMDTCILDSMNLVEKNGGLMKTTELFGIQVANATMEEAAEYLGDLALEKKTLLCWRIKYKPTSTYK